MSDRSEFLTHSRAIQEHSLIRNIYFWMTGGLALTGIISLWLASNPQRIVSLYQSGLIWAFLIAEMVVVFILSARITTMKPSTAALSFIIYSVLNGITISSIFIVYTRASLASTFFITAGTFAGMSLWAATTKKDLSGWGNYLFMALIGLIIATVVNIFLRSPGFYYFVGYAGVLIFCGLTAYDTQSILKMSRSYSEAVNDDDYMRFSIIGALKLYLDFINMFLFLLRIFGRRN